MAAAAVEEHLGTVIEHLQAITLQLWLVDPAVAGGLLLVVTGLQGWMKRMVVITPQL